MSYWSDKVALVTGGSQGLGLALAQALAQRKARVVIAARGQQALDNAKRQLESLGAVVLAVAADVTRDDDVARLVAQTVDRFGRLDALLNNAGASSRGTLLNTPPEEFLRLLELNLLSIVRCTRAAAPHLQAARGHVVNIGSLAGKSAARFLGAYPAAKFAVSGYTQQLRLELGPEVHVLLVCPGPIAHSAPRQRTADALRDVPPEALGPGGGVKTRLIDPARLAGEVLEACQARRLELVRPAKARLLFALAQLSPRLGDWIVTRST